MSTEENEERQVEVLISHLVMDPKLQVRNKPDEGTVQRYVAVLKSGKEMPPVRVALVDKMLLLVDGWHRVAAHQNIGEPEIKAIITKESKTNAIWLAAKANLEHGLPLKNKEVQNVFKAYIRSGQHRDSQGYYKSYRQIGREIGKTHHTIITWTRKFFPHLIGKMGSEDIVDKEFPLPPDIPSNFAPEIQQALEEAFDGFQATSDPSARGWIIDHTQTVLNRMKGSGRYTLPDF